MWAPPFLLSETDVVRAASKYKIRTMEEHIEVEGKILTVLAGNSIPRVNQALLRLMNAKPVDEQRERVVKALEPLTARKLQRRITEVDRDPALLLLGQPVGVFAGQRPDEPGLAVVDVPGGADGQRHGKDATDA